MDARLNQGAEVSLSGNLGFVSLDEVLRLLTRSKQSGTVDVKGDSVRGRIFVHQKGIGLATTFEDDALRRHLSRSGLLSTDEVSRIASGDLDLAGLPEAEQMTGLLREMSVESLYQMGLHGSAFDVREGHQTPFSSPGAFDLEDLLAAARQRLTDWEEVRAIVSDLDRDLRLNRDLGERDQVTIDRDSWRVVSEIGDGVSIRGLADQLGTTEFWAARVAAGLVEEGLVSMELGVAEPVDQPAPADGDWHEPAPSTDFEEASLPEPTAAVTEESVAEVAEEVDPGETEVDPDQSWWQEPEGKTDETADTTADEEGPGPETDQQEPETVEEDTESFLEKVFSELETPEDEAEEGYGLLRRRRMGTLRDSVN